ncbi:PEP-CTERM sorting domain-containing protein [Phycisphaeraceae bacterium D3-23]
MPVNHESIFNMMKSNPLRLAARGMSALVVAAVCAAPALGQQTFDVGSEGFSNNQWPGGEVPANAIDGTVSKYLNFDTNFTFAKGIAVTPSSGASIVTSMEIWTANDEPARDPSNFEIWGSNTALTGAETQLDLATFTQIATGDLALPIERNTVDLTFSQTVNFANSDSYMSYIVFFPDVTAAANSMQIAEVQLYDNGTGVFAPGDTILGGEVNGTPIPEPGSLALLGLGGLAFMRRRR